jgi:transcriptional regulator with PAS, ATPase and Fis domain
MTKATSPDDMLEQRLYAALPLVGRISTGFATVTDAKGRRLRTVDSHGREIVELRGVVYELAREAFQHQSPMFGPSGIIPEAEAWAIPTGNYVLSGCNVERIERDEKLRHSLSQALPLIAGVVGGEAVLFDREGRRLESIDPLGRCNLSYIGKISEAAQRAMKTQQPVIDTSMSVPGAIAVRIPMTENYGLGFNNERTVFQKQKLIEEVKKFQYARYNFDDIIGASKSISLCKALAANVAQGSSSVLISGETGTGKELFAQAIHNASSRRNKPFIAINCGAMPGTLIEGNLFGYVEGAFTGAKKGGSPGFFEAAQHGTLFLDEISEMDMELQARLLRVLQEHEVIRIGSTKAIPIDVRIIAATNKQLRDRISQKLFREDLFYRLNVVELKIPPLRERKDDIEGLARIFLERYNHILGKMINTISPGVTQTFQAHSWPGNTRELQNCIESCLNVVQFHERTLELRHLPSQFAEDNGALQPKLCPDRVPCANDLATTLRFAERELLTRVLKEENNNHARAAKKLGISTTTLWRKLCERKKSQK